MANQKRGRQSFILPNPPVITHWASVAGKKESEGPLAHTFDIKSQDTYFGQKTWEQGEKQMQKLALEPGSLLNAAKRAWGCGRPDAAATLADLVESLGRTPIMEPVPVYPAEDSPRTSGREAFA